MECVPRTVLFSAPWMGSRVVEGHARVMIITHDHHPWVGQADFLSAIFGVYGMVSKAPGLEDKAHTARQLLTQLASLQGMGGGGGGGGDDGDDDDDDDE
jgi:hypothetical protein